MHIFGHNGLLSKIDNGISDGLHELNKIGHKLFGGGPGHEDEGGTDWYVGYNSNSGPNLWIGPGQKTYNTNPTGKGIKPNAYSRSSAATAKDIAQGGMTKDEIIDFNQRHPNETAITGGN